MSEGTHASSHACTADRPDLHGRARRRLLRCTSAARACAHVLRRADGCCFARREHEHTREGTHSRAPSTAAARGDGARARAHPNSVEARAQGARRAPS
eukprot:5420249-Pleurochrysis_carterae.AAC.1